MADVITRFKVDLSQYDPNLRKAKASTSGFAKQASADFARMGKSIQAAIGPLAALTAAAGAAHKVFGDMVTMNRDFEQANANLAAVLGTSRDNITALTEDAKRLGASTMFTASQVTQLQTELAKLGFNQQEIKAATGDVLNLAAATGTDLATAAAQAGATMRGFGLNASEMDRVASVLAVSTSKSALSMEKLGVALPVVQTTAAKTGFTLEDTVAMLGKLTDNGINAASAGTQLRKIMNDASTAGTKLANYLGGPVHSLDELQKALNKAAKEGMSHADSVALVNSKNATALDILRDMSTATDGETASVVKLRDELNGCSDALQGMVDEQMNTLEGSCKTLSSAWEGLMLSFSSSNGIMKGVVDGLTKMIQKITEARTLAAGGQAAVDIRAGGLKDEDKAKIDAEIKGKIDGGASAESLLEGTTKKREKLQKEYDELFKLYADWQKEAKLGYGSQGAKAFEAQLKAIGVEANYSGKEQFENILAKKQQKLNKMDYAITALTPASPATGTGTPTGDDEDPVKKQIKMLTAQEKAQIESLDRQKMTQAEYEDEVYQIKLKYLQKMQNLYAADSEQYFDYAAKISDLNIQQQAKVFNRANKKSPKGKTYEVQTGTSGWSEANISGMQSDLKQQMAGMQMGSEEYMAAMANSIDITTFSNLMNEALKNGVTIDESTIEPIFEQMFNGENIPDSVWTELTASINEQLAALGIDPIKLDVKTGGIETVKKDAKGTEDAFNAAASAIGSVSGALNGLEDPGAKVAGLIGQAIASIAATFAGSLKGTFTPWDWIAAAAAGTATMISTITAIKSATSGYAEGGLILPNGSPYQGDNIVARLNAGEGVLTAQGIENAGRLASQTNVAGGTMGLRTEISGENLAIVLDNNNRRRGRSATIRR